MFKKITIPRKTSDIETVVQELDSLRADVLELALELRNFTSNCTIDEAEGAAVSFADTAENISERIETLMNFLSADEDDCLCDEPDDLGSRSSIAETKALHADLQQLSHRLHLLSQRVSSIEDAVLDDGHYL